MTSIVQPIADLMTLLHTAYNLLCYMVGLTFKLVLLTCYSCDNRQLEIAYYHKDHLFKYFVRKCKNTDIANIVGFILF